jgi:hypothetical protein
VLRLEDCLIQKEVNRYKTLDFWRDERLWRDNIFDVADEAAFIIVNPLDTPFGDFLAQVVEMDKTPMEKEKHIAKTQYLVVNMSLVPDPQIIQDCQPIFANYQELHSNLSSAPLGFLFLLLFGMIY